jgi:hypothetical protein
MCAKSRFLWLVSLPALMLCMTEANALEGKPGSAERIKDCNERLSLCEQYCTGAEPDRQNCKNKCIGDYGNCLGEPAARKVPIKPKVQPKVTPGGAETPGTTSPNVQPKGGIQRY